MENSIDGMNNNSVRVFRTCSNSGETYAHIITDCKCFGGNATIDRKHDKGVRRLISNMPSLHCTTEGCKVWKAAFSTNVIHIQ